jgi:hypothetical protein
MMGWFLFSIPVINGYYCRESEKSSSQTSPHTLSAECNYNTFVCFFKINKKIKKRKNWLKMLCSIGQQMLADVVQ